MERFETMQIISFSIRASINIRFYIGMMFYEVIHLYINAQTVFFKLHDILFYQILNINFISNINFINYKN